MTFSNPGHHSRISLEVTDTHRLKIKCGDFLLFFFYLILSYFISFRFASGVNLQLTHFVFFIYLST